MSDNFQARHERRLTIVNKRGLHARAAAKFVTVAGGFKSAIEVERNGQAVSGRSIMGLMMLAASIDTEIIVRAEGPDADAALDAIEEMVAAKFDED
jgi:phosphocarrier protein HPr